MQSHRALISRRGFLGAVPAALATWQSPPVPPNIVLILADDLGWNDVGYRNPDVRTPNLDALANRGVKFEQYRTNAVCSPTRASLLTGRSAFRVGIPNPVTAGRDALPVGERLLPQMLAEVGYQTWLVGKWHLGEIAPQYLPHKRGFQYHYGFLGGEVDYWKHTSGNRVDWYRNGEPLNEEGYTTELLANDAVRIIRERDPNRPFFLDLSLNAPHSPLQGREPYLSHFADVKDDKRRNFLAMVEDMDAAIGQVYRGLEEEGIAGNTLLIWMSDNGGQTSGGGASNTPLRGMKAEAFDGGLRVPAFALWPKVLDGGVVFDRFMTAMDWVPTLAGVAGYSLDPNITLDGSDMWPCLRNAECAGHPAAIVGGGTNYAVFQDGWKLVEQSPPNQTPQRYLFRILDDPSEERNLAADYPLVVEDLVAILRNHPVGQADTLK